MFGYCKPRKEFVSRLINGQTYQFKECNICEYDDLGDLYSVDADYYHVNFTKEIFYEKFRVIPREAEYFETDCIVDIETYKSKRQIARLGQLAFLCDTLKDTKKLVVF